MAFLVWNKYLKLVDNARTMKINRGTSRSASVRAVKVFRGFPDYLEVREFLQ